MNIIIPLNPITKKNSQRIFINSRTGRPFVTPSEKFKEYQEDAGLILRLFPAYSGEYPVNIKYSFYMETKRRVDLSNLIEAADDILTHYAIIKDDSSQFVGGHDGSRIFYDKDNPRTEIIISKLV